MARIWNKHKQTNTPLKRKVFVGMSGGVDSSVAAFLLSTRGGSTLGGKKEEYDITGVFMKCFNLDGCAERDAEDARRVAEHIGIPFYVFDFEEEYKKRVVEYMINGYKMGITPNPDVMCNREIKFGMFLERALALGADYIATGHYVRLRRNDKFQISNFKSNPNKQISNLKIKKLKIDLKFKIKNLKFHLFEAKDGNKDQSYFLWTLTQDQLKHSLFPIGDYTKPEVREIARKAKLPTAEKKDSQGICFLGNISVSDFLKSYIKGKEGNIVTIDGKVIGKHKGAEFYTIGQRHLGISNIKYFRSRASVILDRQKSKNVGDRKPYYVVEKNIKTNTIIVAEGSENPDLFRKEIGLSDVNFISPYFHSPIRANWRMEVLARVRYRQPISEAVFIKTEDKSLKIKNVSTYKLIFKNPQKFIAPGQSVVFYAKQGPASSMEDSVGKEVLGGGVII